MCEEETTQWLRQLSELTWLLCCLHLCKGDAQLYWAAVLFRSYTSVSLPPSLSSDVKFKNHLKKKLERGHGSLMDNLWRGCMKWLMMVKQAFSSSTSIRALLMLACLHYFLLVSAMEFISVWLMYLGNCGKMFENIWKCLCVCNFSQYLKEWEGRGNIFLPLCDSLKSCSWHSSLCSDRVDFSRIWSRSLNLGFKGLLRALCCCLSSSTSLVSVSPLHVVLMEAAGAGEGENAQAHSCHVSEWKYTSDTWYTCFSWSEAVVFHWTVITTTRDTEIIKWRGELMCPYWYPGELLIAFIPFLVWPEQN